MTEQEVRELEVWVAEKVFGVKVAYDGEGEAYADGAVAGDLVFGYIPHFAYTGSLCFGRVKREIERRGWSWYSEHRRYRTGRCEFYFRIYETAPCEDNEYQVLVRILGEAVAATEEVAGCLAMKEAVSESP